MRTSPLLVCGFLLAGATACSTSAATRPAAAPSHPQVTVRGLEDLARQTGCSVQVETNATELRQGTCRTGAGRYTLLTFPTDRAAGTWLSEAKIWGGTYLVGSRWVIVGTPAQLAGFQARLGGVVQNGRTH